MILSKEAIIKKIKSGELVFSPAIDQFQLQMHSVDLRLGFNFLIPKSWDLTPEGRVAIISDHLDSGTEQEKHISIQLNEGQFFDILPGEHIAVSSLESVTIPADIMGVLYPRSSVNRRGLSVDLTGIVDAGYEGHLLIPVRNNTDDQIIRIYPGERFCQLVFEDINGLVELQKSRWHKLDRQMSMQSEKNEQEMLYLKSGKITQLKTEFAILL